MKTNHTIDAVRHAGAAVVLAVALVLPLTAAGQSSPEAVVRERNETVKATLDRVGDDVSDEVREELKDVINGLIDFRELSRLALARYWEERTPQEKDEFIDLLRELVRNSSVQKLEVYKADSIVYRPAKIEDGRASVMTTAHQGSNDVDIEYLMHQVDGEWRAYDVIIDGSSTMRTYRDSFLREIRASSYEAMFQRMKDRLERTKGGLEA